MTTLPQEILKLKQWTVSYSLRELKRPLDSLYRPQGGLTYTEAVKKAGKHKNIGMYVTSKDPYVLGDVDHVGYPMDKKHLATILPIGFCDLLFNQSIYSEASPSGDGIRFIARLKDYKDKELLVGNYRKNREPMGEDPDGNKREAQLNLGRPWMRLTGRTTPYSSNRISTIDTDTITNLFNYRLKVDDVVGTDYRPPPSEPTRNLPSLSHIFSALRSLPWDENPRIRRSFKYTFEEEYTSYEYWLKVIMALSDFASRIDSMSDQMLCLEEIVKWSANDENGYTGEEDVIKKWESLMRQESKVTYHTLLALAHYNTLIWPQKKPVSKAQKDAGVATATPMVAQYSNFKAMVDFYNLVLYRDANTPYKMYLTGDEDILDHYFKHLDTKMYHGKYLGPWTNKTLVPKFHAMCQDQGYLNITANHVAQNLAIWMGDINKTVDMVLLFFDTPYDDLVSEYKSNEENNAISNVESVFDCLTIDHITEDHAKEEALYYRYYKAWLMGIARNIFYPESQHMNNCVLLLTGPEQIRKTSHFKYILPQFMRDERIAFTPHGFDTETSVRDVTKLASTNNLVVWDEIEQFLNSKTESNFKKLIDNNPVKIIDKYEVLDTYIRPIAVYGGTSNQREFQLSDNGSRRLFIIPVSWVATDIMEKVNWWKVINDLRDELESAPTGTTPWLLTEEELQFQVQLHSKVTSKSSLDLILEEMFDFNQPWVAGRNMLLPSGFDFRRSDYLWTASTVSQRIKRSGMHDKFSRKHLVNVLRRKCSKWTETSRSTKEFKHTKVYIKKGEVYQAGRSKFWMPPLLKSTDTKGYFDDDV